jgi:hypothetical protein
MSQTQGEAARSAVAKCFQTTIDVDLRRNAEAL